MTSKTPFTTLPVFYALELVYSEKHRTERKAMSTNLRELKRQSKYLQTIIKRSDEKHAATQDERRMKAAKIDEQIALTEQKEAI